MRELNVIPYVLPLSLLALSFVGCSSESPSEPAGQGAGGAIEDGGGDKEPDSASRGSGGVGNTGGIGGASGSGGTGPSGGASGSGAGASGNIPILPDGPLKDLPSPAGAHIAQIENLGDNEWLALENPSADPEYGVARGRAWGGRALIPVSELRGAFFTGEGVHAFVKPDGFAMDDLWFYDIQQNRWIAVYPGMHVDSFNDRVASGDLKIDENGEVIDGNGHHVPIHTLLHAWDFLTYDTKRHRFTWLSGAGMGRFFLPGESTMEDGLTVLEAQREAVGNPPPMSPWYYNVESHSFLREPIQNGSSDIGSYSAFFYLPSQDRIFNGGSNGVQFFDPNTNEWSKAQDQGPRPPGYDHGVAYDWRRERIYMGTGDADTEEGLFIYDIATETWSRPKAIGGPKAFRTNSASAIYDDANDVLTVFHYPSLTLYTYHPDQDQWSSVPIPAEVKAVGYAGFHAFYDNKLNAYFVYVAPDSSDNGRMFVYRYRNP